MRVFSVLIGRIAGILVPSSSSTKLEEQRFLTLLFHLRLDFTDSDELVGQEDERCVLCNGQLAQLISELVQGCGTGQFDLTFSIILIVYCNLDSTSISFWNLTS